MLVVVVSIVIIVVVASFWIASWLERRTRDRKVVSSNPAGAAGEFSSPESILCTDSYSVSVPPQCYRSDT